MITVASLNVSVAQSEQTIDDLVSSAASIQQSIVNAQKGIYGITAYAPLGGIAPDSVLDSGKISQSQIDAYNNALAGVANATYYDAQQFFDDQYETSMEDLTSAVDTFSAAALELNKVIEVAEIAAEADTVTEQQNLQTYISDNDVEITQSEVAAYNQSLDEITDAAQSAAAFKAAANDTTMKDIANDVASDYNQSLYEATASFTAASDRMVLAFANGSSLTFGGFFQDDMKSTMDIMGMGSSIYEEQGWQ